MRTSSVLIGVCVSTLLLGVCAAASGADGPAPGASGPAEDMSGMGGVPSTLAEWSAGAMAFGGLGDFHRTVTTSSPQAQRFFDQGMRLMWAFNHDEATRSFAEAARLDPACAMCYWGVALTVGPNYNMPMMARVRAQVALHALHQAQRNAARGTPVEQALIAALARRYPTADALDPSNEAPVLTAYADAMRSVAKRFPDDLDVQTMFAEAMMDLNAWKLWSADGQPAPGTGEIVAVLESVLRRDPGHPGANHYYVHAVEASPHPEKALAEAERLRDMMPAAGHLVHMPAHVMQRVGRYEDAAEANRRGARADAEYLAKARPPDYYGMYVAHNYQFLAYSTAMEGRRAETLEAVRRMRDGISDAALAGMPGVDWYLVELYQANVRFGLWDAMLAEPAPSEALPGLTGGYLYGRGIALAATGKIDEARDTLVRLRRLAGQVPAETGAGVNAARDLLTLSATVLEARIAAAQHDDGTADRLLQEAVTLEDGLTYDEPSAWFFPVRQMLGAQLLREGRARDAETVYQEDLRRNPENGWSLFGLAKALEAQGRSAQAGQVESRFETAWKRADTRLTASAF